MTRILAWLALVAGVGVTGWGFHAARLFSQQVWVPQGLERLLWFVAVYVVAFGAIWLFRPGWFVPVVLAGAAVYTVAVVGIVAPPAVALLLMAALLVGRRFLPEDDPLALLLGLAIYAWAAGLAAYFPVNYPAVYVAAMLLPVGLSPRAALDALRRCAGLFRPTAAARRKTEAARGLLIAVLLAHWLVALKPEVSADGLAMHLAAPAAIAAEHRWSFDVERVAWAVMPMEADWAYTLAYLPGGEFAARLLNLGELLVLAALLERALRKYAPGAPALLLTALFAASPIVQLATGSLMAENLWAALLFGALAAWWNYRETGERKWLYATAALAGAGLSTKFGTLAFLVPLAALMAPMWWRKRLAWRPLAVFLAFACPPYLTAWAKTGNPVFPFLNAVFKSPYFDTAANFAETRFHEPLRWDTLYAMTFHTGRFLESQRGGWGFQYLCLLPLSLVLLRRRWPYAARSALFVAAGFFLLTFPYQGNLRYLYPALPLLTLVLGAGLAALRSLDARLFRAAAAAAVALALLNFYFLPASGWYHRDFFPPARGDRERYLDFWTPARRIIDYLNARHPGAPVMYIEGDAIAGLRARAYTLTWHTESFNRRVRATGSAIDCLRLMNRLGVRYFIAPAPDSGAPVPYVQLQLFLTAFTTPEFRSGTLYLARLVDAYAGPAAAERVRQVEAGLEAVPPGAYDDSSPFIWYSGAWVRDIQFEEAANHTLTYSNAAGASLRFSFSGSLVTYVYTAAPNRGMAQIEIDGASKGRLDQYSPQVRWQARAAFGGLGPGKHTLVLRVLGTRNPAAGDGYVDLDQLIVN